jgi:hypothetical protein
MDNFCASARHSDVLPVPGGPTTMRAIRQSTCSKGYRTSRTLDSTGTNSSMDYDIDSTVTAKQTVQQYDPVPRHQ